MGGRGKGSGIRSSRSSLATCEFETSLGYTETLYLGRKMKLPNLKMKLASLAKDTSTKCGGSRVSFLDILGRY